MIKIKRVLPPGYIIKDVDHSELEVRRGERPAL
jgi:hypothetical protein